MRVAVRWKYALAGLLAFGLLAFGPATLAAGPTIDVTGTGSVDVVPDQATLSLGVTTRGQTAAEAVTANNTAMQGLIAALQGTGVAADQIRTTNFYVGPVYTTPDPAQVPGIAGFECSDSVRVDLADVSTVGHLIDVALAAGANQIQGVSFTVADISAPEQQALTMAVADARSKAAVIAAAAGLQLGPIQSISYEVAGTPYPTAAYGMGGGGTPVLPGQQSVTVHVHMVFGAS